MRRVQPWSGAASEIGKPADQIRRLGGKIARHLGLTTASGGWREQMAASEEFFEYCVVQVYNQHKRGIVPHMDKEQAADTPIFGLSLGEQRTLSMSRSGRTTHQFNVTHGSLYCINPPTNEHWKHSIGKEDESEQAAKTEPKYFHRERNASTFQRMIRFPSEIDVERVEGSLEAGVLTIRVPKAASASRALQNLKAQQPAWSHNCAGARAGAQSRPGGRTSRCESFRRPQRSRSAEAPSAGPPPGRSCPARARGAAPPPCPPPPPHPRPRR